MRSAQAELDLLTAGVRDETLAAAAGAVAEAEAVLQQAQADLADTELRAPFAGTVTALQVNPGENVGAGQVLLTLADLSHLQVETTDLSEVDVAQRGRGAARRGHRGAAGGRNSGPGGAHRAAGERDRRGRGLSGRDRSWTRQPAGLRWGMSAEVEILTE